ncbi:MAG: hypothetical protein ACYC91_06335 [Solirubrobacteraceae bacterium]
MNARRAAPTLLAAVLAGAYIIVSPPSLDLAAHMLRARLFSAEGFGLWNNWWYAGHHVAGYSVLFPPLAAALTPQLTGGLAAVATAAAFEALAHRHFGERAWLGALWFGAATATDLYTGRLTFAFGLLPAVATALALQRGRPTVAGALALVTPLASPVAALFAALTGAAYAVAAPSGERRTRLTAGAAVVGLALAPVLALAVAFPEGGSEPFAFSALWPIPLIAIVALLAADRSEHTLRAGLGLYALGCLASYAVSTPVGSNVVRLGALLGGPLAAMLWWRRRSAWLLLAALPLLYIQWQAPVRDLRTSVGDPAGSRGYWLPLLSFLGRQVGPPFRVEIPFTQFHWEAYEVAPRFSIARGWERQLDIRYNALFYDGRLTSATYAAWLHHLAVRFVAVSDARLDYSAWAETALIQRGLPYLRLVWSSRHWRVFAVAGATPIVTGAATLSALGPNSISLRATRPGHALVRVRFTPYWKLSGGPGCVSPQGDFTAVSLRRAGRVRLVIAFSLGRVAQQSPRCS